MLLFCFFFVCSTFWEGARPSSMDYGMYVLAIHEMMVFVEPIGKALSHRFTHFYLKTRFYFSPHVLCTYLCFNAMPYVSVCANEIRIKTQFLSLNGAASE